MTLDSVLFDGPGPEAQFRQALAAGRLQFQQCRDCQHSVFYPRVVCPHCGSVNLEWRESKGEGTVYSFTRVCNVPEGQQPYNICLVDLKEGVRVLSRIDGVAPEWIEIGMPVKADVDTYNDQPIIVFKSV